MVLVLKLFGMVLLFFGCAAFGFLKSNSFSLRVGRLRHICFGLSALYERVAIGGEKQNLLSICFPENIVHDGRAISAHLNDSDKKLLEEFLACFGTADIELERNRIRSYKELFQKQLSAAENEAEQGCKLYKTLGICAGFFGCIFLF